MKKASRSSDGLALARIDQRAKQVAALVDLKEQIDAGLADSNALIGKLTPTQQTRALATLSGASLGEIAKAQGVAKQSVAESVAKPAVRLAVREMLTQMIAKEISVAGIVTNKTFQQLALEAIVAGLQANRVYTYGNYFVERADWDVRLRCAEKIIALSEPVVPPPIATTETPTIVEEVAIEETTTHRRATRSRGR